MGKMSIGFSIFLRMLFLNLLFQFTVFTFLMSFIFTPLLQNTGSLFIMLTPSLFYAVFAILLVLLCNIRLLSINMFLWKRVFTSPLNWLTCYKAYALLAVLLAISNLIFTYSASQDAWANYKLWSNLIFFLVVPFVISFRLKQY